jgi:hypothetical protein
LSIKCASDSHDSVLTSNESHVSSAFVELTIPPKIYIFEPAAQVDIISLCSFNVAIIDHACNRRSNFSIVVLFVVASSPPTA